MNCFSKTSLGNLLVSFLSDGRIEYLSKDHPLNTMALRYVELFI